MENLIPYSQLELISFQKIAFAHSLAADNYSYHVNTHGYGMYGRTPKNGGILEIGFVEQNPVICTGEFGQCTFEENSIFIIPPQTELAVSVKNPGSLHRHTSAEFLIRCRSEAVENYAPPSGKTVPTPASWISAAPSARVWKPAAACTG